MIQSPLNEAAEIRLASLEQDGITIFLLGTDQLRGALVHGTRMITQMRENHRTGILETLALGHAYLAAGLLTSTIKGDDRVSLHIECGGPIGGITAEATAHGDIRGYIKHNPIEVQGTPESFDLSPHFGPGFLTVTKHLQEAKHPFSGQVMLTHGSIAKDLAEYFLASEQTRTLFFLSIQFSPSGETAGAGGLFLQALPGADNEHLEEATHAALSVPSLGDYFSRGNAPETLIEDAFGSLEPKIIGHRPVQFFCHCTKEYYASYLASMHEDTKKSILQEGPFPLVISCHNCSSEYSYSRSTLENLLQ